MRVLGADQARRPRSFAWRGADVLVLSPTPTHPQDYGNRKRIFSICSRLSARGARIVLAHYPTEAEWRRRVPAAATTMARAWHAYYTIPTTRPLHSEAESTEHTIDEWWDEAIADFLRWLFGVSQFDVFIVCYSWLSKAFDVAPDSVIKILDTHDRLAGRRSLLQKQGIAPEFFHTTDEEEAKALDRADVVWAIKEQERVLFERLTSRPVLSLSHLDPIRPLPIPPPDPEGYLRVGVIGAGNNFNLTNLHDFLGVALPIFERFFAPVLICIAGGVCDRLRGYDERFVRLIGRVHDVEDFYRSVDLVAITMQTSTGLKTKTGEAIAFGLPVVSLDHGFEGYPARHPLHTLADFAVMAERLVDIAFDRDLLPGLRTASLSAAHAAEIEIEATIEKTWQSLTPMRRAVIFCVSTVVFDDKAVERSAFLSALEYLGEMANLTVLAVEGSVEPLLAAGRELDAKARVVVASSLVDSDRHLAALRARGLAIAPIEDVLAGYGQKIVIVDALSEELLDIGPTAGIVVLRAELLAQRIAIEPRLETVAGLLRKFARPVVMAPQSSPILAELAARSGAEIVTAPCCWRSNAARHQIGSRRQLRRALVLADPRLHGLSLLVGLLRDLGLEPILVRAPFPVPGDRPAPEAACNIDWLSAPEYLLGLTGGRGMLPAFALDLSFGALGLQYLRELLHRLGVPIIGADAAVPQPSVIAPGNGDYVHTYEELVAQILSAARGLPIGDAAQRHRLDLELEGDGGWTWLWRYGFDSLGLSDIGPASFADAAL
jgi:glycosyltransferase involved in cell wall biosynthesis